MAKIRTWKPLATEHIEELITLAVESYRLANRTPSMQRLASYLIKLAVWRRTADAVDSATGIVIPDAIKYDIRYLPHTADAALISAQYPMSQLKKYLTHEHSFPLGLFAEKIFNLDTDNREAIGEIFNTCCRAAIVTREEDSKLNSAKLRSAMPTNWSFGEDIFARYSSVGIELLPPSIGWR